MAGSPPIGESCAFLVLGPLKQAVTNTGALCERAMARYDELLTCPKDSTTQIEHGFDERFSEPQKKPSESQMPQSLLPRQTPR